MSGRFQALASTIGCRVAHARTKRRAEDAQDEGLQRDSSSRLASQEHGGQGEGRGVTSDWMSNWREIPAGPEYLRGTDRYPDFPDDQDFSDVVIEPTLEGVGRLVRSCSLLEIALFRALSTLDLRISFTEAESKHRPNGCIRKLPVIAAELKPVRIRGVRGRLSLEALLDDAHEYLELRHGVVHGRPGRQYMFEVYESRRWVVRKGEDPELVTTVYDRNRLMLAAARAGNVASDILAGLAEWECQTDRIRREQRKALGPGHPLRVETDGTDVGVSHALSTGSPGQTLCGLDASAMEPALTYHADESQRTEIVFEDSNNTYHCEVCRRAFGGRQHHLRPRGRDPVGASSNVAAYTAVGGPGVVLQDRVCIARRDKRGNCVEARSVIADCADRGCQ
jgi:hypothetical protein